MVVPLIAGLAIATVAGILSAEAGKKAASAAVTSKFGQQLAQNKRVAAIMEEERLKIIRGVPSANLAGVSISAYDIPGAPIFTGNAYAQNVYKQMKAQGFNNYQALEVAKVAAAREIGGGAGEAVGSIVISSASAAAANKIAAKSLAKQGITKATQQQLGKILPKEAAKAGLKGGIFEGGAMQVVQDIARDRPKDLKNVAASAALGGLTGATGGYVLGKVYASKMSPTKKKLIDVVGQTAIDPYEKVGDVIGERFIGSPRIAVITPSAAPTLEQTITITTEGGKTVKRKISIPTITPTPSQTGKPSKSNTPFRFGIITPNIGSPTPNPNTGTPTQIGSITPAPTPAETGSITPTPTPEPTPTPTPTPAETSVFTPVPTPTPILRNMPLLPTPLSPADVRGAGEYGRSGRYVYYNDLEKMNAMLKGMGFRR